MYQVRVGMREHLSAGVRNPDQHLQKQQEGCMDTHVHAYPEPSPCIIQTGGVNQQKVHHSMGGVRHVSPSAL